jgi:hypothetical protein
VSLASQRPRVTVVVPRREDVSTTRLTAALASQSLDDHLFEVVEARYGPGRAAGETAPGARLVRVGDAGRSAAVGAAFGAARGDHAVVLDPGDEPTHDLLSRLLARVTDGLLPTACPAVRRGGSGPDLENDLATPLLAHAGRDVSVHEAIRVLEHGRGVLVPVESARAVMGGGVPADTPGFWVTLAASSAGRLAVVRPATAHLVIDDPVASGPPRNLEDALALLEVSAGLSRALLRAAGPFRGDASALARSWQKRLSEDLNAWLLREPEAHADLVARAHAQGVVELDWSCVNAGLAHDLAVLYCFPPFVDTSAVVAARRLRARGVVTDVVSQDLYHEKRRDFLSEHVAAEVVDRSCILEGPADLIRWAETRDFAKRVLQQVDELELAKGPYRSLYSRAMHVPAHLAAAAVKLRRPALRWTAEFSDPLRRNTDGVDRVGDMDDDWLSRELHQAVAVAGFPQQHGSMSVFEWAEVAAYALADELVFTNENQRDYMLEYCRDRSLAGRARRIGVVRHHPTPPPELYRLRQADYPLDPDVVNLGYFGVFYGRRGLAEVTGALAALTPDEREGVRLHVFTNAYEKWSLQVLRSGLSDVIRVMPYLDYLSFLELTTRLDVVVCADTFTADLHASNPYLPSKVSDYVGSGTPIWAICEPGSVLSTMQLAHSSALGDVDAAVTVLRSLIQHHTPSSSVQSHQSQIHC